jgi:hypothetical protein
VLNREVAKYAKRDKSPFFAVFASSRFNLAEQTRFLCRRHVDTCASQRNGDSRVNVFVQVETDAWNVVSHCAMLAAAMALKK